MGYGNAHRGQFSVYSMPQSNKFIVLCGLLDANVISIKIS